ncbi:MAG: helix-turn-helix domain-containing protein [Streptosporangiales bacterium]|nr:helix-turn-helix domain-containing protein [Streptosporangiales bacterium]
MEAVSVLHDPVRRALYRHVVAEGRDVSRNEAAAALGIQRSLAAFHLDKLAEAGLLDVAYRRLGERRGPGAGRPAKLYRRGSNEYHVSLPPRAYETAARLLAEAVEIAGADQELQEVARERGRELGRAAEGTSEGHGQHGERERLGEVLAQRGYEPRREGDLLRLRNCPFHVLAGTFPPLVCGMNLALLEGLLEGLETKSLAARMDPRPGWCCVVLSSKNSDN